MINDEPDEQEKESIRICRLLNIKPNGRVDNDISDEDYLKTSVFKIVLLDDSDHKLIIPHHRPLKIAQAIFDAGTLHGHNLCQEDIRRKTSEVLKTLGLQ